MKIEKKAEHWLTQIQCMSVETALTKGLKATDGATITVSNVREFLQNLGLYEGRTFGKRSKCPITKEMNEAWVAPPSSSI